MTMRHGAERPASGRIGERSALLEKAFVRTGVREMLEIHAYWQQLDRYVEHWRRAATPPAFGFSTDRSV